MEVLRISICIYEKKVLPLCVFWEMCGLTAQKINEKSKHLKN